MVQLQASQGARADHRPPLKAPKMGTLASELNRWAQLDGAGNPRVLPMSVPGGCAAFFSRLNHTAPKAKVGPTPPAGGHHTLSWKWTRGRDSLVHKLNVSLFSPVWLGPDLFKCHAWALDIVKSVYSVLKSSYSVCVGGR